MSDHDHDHATGSLSRRAILRGGATVAWAVPAITVVAAAPALAASGGPLTVNPGTTAVSIETGPGFSGPINFLRFAGFTIVPSAAVAAGALRMVVTYSVAASLYNDYAAPAGWTSSPAPNSINSVASITYVYAAAVAASSPVAFANGIYFDGDNRGGTFTLTISAPGLTTSALTFAPVQPARRRDVARPR